MQFETSHELEPGIGELAVCPVTATENGPQLASFCFNGRGGGLSTGLEWLGGELKGERWQVHTPVAEGITNGIAWRCGGGLCFLSAQSSDDGRADVAALTDDLYRRLLKTAQATDHPWLLRIWNYLPDINAGAGDAERYRRFCVGRARALEWMGIQESRLCAGSAIGGEEPVLRLYALTGRLPGHPIENPRQVSAYRYPRSYGPRSPSFTRATALSGQDGTVTLMISGTASVVGHATAHAGDLDGQLQETARNLDALLGEAALALDRPRLARFDTDSLMRIYVRNRRDWPQVKTFVDRTWPQVQSAGLRGDICRGDLLVEIEAVHRG